MINNFVNAGPPLYVGSGVGASRAAPTHRSGGRLHRLLGEGFQRTVTRKWHRRKSIAQFFAVVRHAERADSLFSFTEGGRWCNSDDCKRYPFDAPLSDFGKEQAKSIGHTLKERAELAETAIHVVVSSPFARCIETAIAIVEANPGARLVIDHSLGEIYGLCTMGPTEPQNPIRRGEDSLEPKLVQTVGKWPIWPEDLRSGRLRFASRFLTYLHRGDKTKRNFVLVSHGDCVAAALAMMPSQANSFILGVEYGGMFVATKTPNKMRKEVLGDLLGALRKKEVAVTTSDARLEASQATSRYVESMDSETPDAPPALSKSCDRWDVETFDIQVGQRADKKSAKSILKSMNKWGFASSLTQNRVEHLLGRLMDGEHLGERELEDRESSCSASTYLFGQSHGESIPSPNPKVWNTKTPSPAKRAKEPF